MAKFRRWFSLKFIITYEILWTETVSKIHPIKQCVILNEILQWLDSKTIELHNLFEVINCVKLINAKFCYSNIPVDDTVEFDIWENALQFGFFIILKLSNIFLLEILEICFVSLCAKPNYALDLLTLFCPMIIIFTKRKMNNEVVEAKFSKIWFLLIGIL